MPALIGLAVFCGLAIAAASLWVLTYPAVMEIAKREDSENDDREY